MGGVSYTNTQGWHSGNVFTTPSPTGRDNNHIYAHSPNRGSLHEAEALGTGSEPLFGELFTSWLWLPDAPVAVGLQFAFSIKLTLIINPALFSLVKNS